jgi:hypothetical protein
LSGLYQCIDRKIVANTALAYRSTVDETNILFSSEHYATKVSEIFTTA